MKSLIFLLLISSVAYGQRESRIQPVKFLPGGNIQKSIVTPVKVDNKIKVPGKPNNIWIYDDLIKGWIRQDSLGYKAKQ